jgi:hypothetical protein
MLACSQPSDKSLGYYHPSALRTDTKPPCLIILDAWLSVWCRITGPLRIKMPGELRSAPLLAVPNLGKKAKV